MTSHDGHMTVMWHITDPNIRWRWFYITVDENAMWPRDNEMPKIIVPIRDGRPFCRCITATCPAQQSRRGKIGRQGEGRGTAVITVITSAARTAHGWIGYRGVYTSSGDCIYVHWYNCRSANENGDDLSVLGDEVRWASSIWDIVSRQWHRMTSPISPLDAL